MPTNKDPFSDAVSTEVITEDVVDPNNPFGNALPPEASEEEYKPDKLNALVAGAGQGVTSGQFSKFTAGGSYALNPGMEGSYPDRVLDYTKYFNDLAEKHPMIYNAGLMGGAAFQTYATLPIKALQGLSLGTRMAWSGIQGALHGEGTSEADDIIGRAEDSATGAAVGLAGEMAIQTGGVVKNVAKNKTRQVMDLVAKSKAAKMFTGIADDVWTRVKQFPERIYKAKTVKEIGHVMARSLHDEQVIQSANATKTANILNKSKELVDGEDILKMYDDAIDTLRSMGADNKGPRMAARRLMVARKEVMSTGKHNLGGKFPSEVVLDTGEKVVIPGPLSLTDLAYRMKGLDEILYGSSKVDYNVGPYSKKIVSKLKDGLEDYLSVNGDYAKHIAPLSKSTKAFVRLKKTLGIKNKFLIDEKTGKIIDTSDSVKLVNGLQKVFSGSDDDATDRIVAYFNSKGVPLKDFVLDLQAKGVMYPDAGAATQKSFLDALSTGVDDMAKQARNTAFTMKSGGMEFSKATKLGGALAVAKGIHSKAALPLARKGTGIGKFEVAQRLISKSPSAFSKFTQMFGKAKDAAVVHNILLKREPVYKKLLEEALRKENNSGTGNTKYSINQPFFVK